VASLVWLVATAEKKQVSYIKNERKRLMVTNRNRDEITQTPMHIRFSQGKGALFVFQTSNQPVGGRSS
jgi:hypothetical protein